MPMSDTTTIELKDIDPDDISDILVKVQKSFGFKFNDTDLKDIKTFGGLCDLVTNKIQGDNTNDCTTQQAFYKLRNAIAETLKIDKSNITTDSDLQRLFPRHKRRHQILTISHILGFKTNILRPKHWVSGTLIVVLLASFAGLFFYWQAGLLGIAFSILGFRVADKFASELDLQTVGQVAEKISRENYLKVRRNPAKVNRIEIAKQVKALFHNDLDLEETELTRHSAFK